MNNFYERKYVPLFLVIYFFLTASHVVGFFVSNGILAIVLFIIFFGYLSLYGLAKKYLLAFFFIISIGMLCSFFSGNYEGSLNLIYFSMMLIIISNVSFSELEKAIDIISDILLVVLFLALISLIYKSFGGQPLAEFKNPDGRPNYLMLTSFSNANYLYFMRPSGIFDEPGALSFHCCACVFSRCALKRKFDNKSTLIVLFGFVTLSLAHFVFAFFYFMIFLFSIREVKSIVKIVIVFLVFIISLYILYDFDSQAKTIIDYFLSRFSYSSSSGFSGNSRGGSFENAYNAINDKNILLGLYQDSCYLSNSCSAVYGDYKQNFLSPLVVHGLIVSFLYYIPFFFILFVSLLRLNFLALAFLLLWIQRPYFITVGYTFWFVLFIFLTCYRKGYRVNRYFL